MDWYPASFFLMDPPTRTNPYAVLILNQPLNVRAYLYEIMRCASLTVAADGGANRWYDGFLANQRVEEEMPEDEEYFDLVAPDAVVGDLDSLKSHVRSTLQAICRNHDPIVHVTDQDSTDFMKALRWIEENMRQRTYSANKNSTPSDEQVRFDVVVMGGIGGRVDQGLSTLHHLAMAALATVDHEYQENPDDDDHAAAASKPLVSPSTNLYLVSEQSVSFMLKKGRNQIHGLHTQRVLPTPSLKWQTERRAVKGGATKDANTAHSRTFSKSSLLRKLQNKIHGSKATDTEEKAATTETTGPRPPIFTNNVGMLPILGPATLSTSGLEWDVQDWKTQFGYQISTSNHVRADAETVVVDVEGEDPGARGVLFTVEFDNWVQPRW